MPNFCFFSQFFVDKRLLRTPKLSCLNMEWVFDHKSLHFNLNTIYNKGLKENATKYLFDTGKVPKKTLHGRLRS